MNKNKYYTTTNFYLASFLLANNFPIFQINRENPQRLSFLFACANTEKIESLVEDFLLGKTLIEPRKFISEIKNLKSAMYTDN